MEVGKAFERFADSAGMHAAVAGVGSAEVDAVVDRSAVAEVAFDRWKDQYRLVASVSGTPCSSNSR